MEVNVGGMLGVRRDKDDEYVSVTSLVQNPPKTVGSAGGIYICINDVTLLKLQAVGTPAGLAIQFAATQGNKNWGKKQIPWNEKSALLKLTRSKNTFQASVQGASKRDTTVASLQWPDLPSKCYAGVVATHYPKNGQAGNFSFTGLYLTTMGRYIRESHQAVHEWGQPKIGELNLLTAQRTWGEHELLYVGLGDAYVKLKQFDKMEVAYKQALRMNPNNTDALNRCAWNFVERGVKLEEAVVFAKKAVSLAPDKAYIFDTLGMAYFKQGKHQDARKELERACALLKKEEKVQTNHIGMFEHLGDAYHNLGEAEAAKKLYLEVIERTKKTISGMKYTNASLVAGMGWMHFKAGQLKEARREFGRAELEIRKFVQFQSWFSRIHERAGDVYLRNKRFEDDEQLEADAAEAYLRAFYSYGRFGDEEGEKRAADKIKKLLDERPLLRKKAKEKGQG
ncbi:MAG: tetratricopeptide repeat protein [Planctomycetota bacterium]|nr:tetratricopeptide repeat protein [Planctomycetota bacterium]